VTARSRQGAPADVVAVLVTLLVAGALGAVVWSLTVDPAEFTKTARGGATMGEVELSKRFAVDGWYAVIAVVTGFACGLGLIWWRHRDVRLTTLLLLPGSALAAAAMALVGRVLGPQDPDVALGGVQNGQAVAVQLEVAAASSYLMWPIGVLLGAVMVLWSSTGVPVVDDDQHEPAPGEADSPASGRQHAAPPTP
jgi:hypothetical protein